jgi:putative membrane protein
MVTRASKISQTDRDRLARIIGESETRTAAELVVVIAETCGPYGVFGFLWPALSAFLVGGVVAIICPAWPAARLFVIQALIFLLLAGLLRWNRLLLRVVPPAIRRAHAHHLAEHQFAIQVQGRTSNETGVLLFVALAERQAFILPDRGVFAVVDPSAWQSIIDRLAVATKAGSVTDALAIAIAEIFAVLSTHFPRLYGSAGTLPNEVIEVPPWPVSPK